MRCSGYTSMSGCGAGFVRILPEPSPPNPLYPLLFARYWFPRNDEYELEYDAWQEGH